MNSPLQPSDRFEIAIRMLKAKGDKESEIRAFVQILHQIERGSRIEKPRKRRAGEAQVNRELARVRALSCKLLEQLDDLSAQTLQSMWDAQAEKMDDGSLVRVDVNKLCENLTFSLQRLNKVAGRAKVSISDNAIDGNADNKKVAGLTKIAGSYYERISGTKPDQSSRAEGFKALLKSLFMLLKIDASVDRATRDLISQP